MLSKRLVDGIAKLETMELLLTVVPFLLLVAFYSRIVVMVARLFKRRVDYLSQLTLDSYTVGTYLLPEAMVSLLVLSFLGSGMGQVDMEPHQMVERFRLLSLTLLFPAVALQLWCLQRYVVLLRKHLTAGWIRTFAVWMLAMVACTSILLLAALVSPWRGYVL